MADNVQRRKEAVSGQYEEMRRISIFSSSEIKMIQRNRAEHENRLNGNAKRLLDYQEYIEYELCLYRLIKAKRKSLIKTDKRSSLEKPIIHGIKMLYSDAMRRFPYDINIYMQYFKFCKEINHTKAAENVCSNMLKYHDDKEDMWLSAARWYLHDGKKHEFAIKFLQIGLRKHETSKILYKECMLYEVVWALSQNTNKTEDNNEVQTYELLNKKLFKYVDAIMEHMPDDTQYYIDLLNWFEMYKFTMPVQNKIIDYLLEKHIKNENVWDYLAQRERRGFHYGLAEDNVCGAENKINLCLKKYEEGLEKVAIEGKGDLWNSYLNCIIDLKNEELSAPSDENRKTLEDAFKRASTSAHLPEQFYISWLDVVDDKLASEILVMATEKLPQSIELWKLRLHLKIAEDDAVGGGKADIISVFESSIKSLQGKAAQSVWKTMWQYHILNSPAEEIDSFFRRAVQQCADISDVFKRTYIEWISTSQGIAKSREIYFELAKLKPYSKEMYKAMCHLESAQLKYNYEMWEKVYELSCEQFGNDDITVWLDYVQYLVSYKPKNTQLPVALEKLYKRAKAALPEYFFVEFDEKYRETVTEFMTSKERKEKGTSKKRPRMML